MYEREEEWAREYFKQAEAKAADVSEMKLEQAVRSGMERAGGRRGRFGKHAAVPVFFALAACLLLFFLPDWTNLSGIRPENGGRETGLPAVWGEYEPYRSAVESNVTLRTAVDAGYVKPLDAESAEVNGFKLKVEGAVADRRGVYLLYSVSSKEDIPFDAKITGLDRLSDSLGYFAGGWVDGASDTTGDKYGFYELSWENEQDFEGEFEFKAKVTPVSRSGANGEQGETAELVARFEADASAMMDTGEELVLNEPITLAGQQLMLQKVYIGPTGIYADVAVDPDNDMDVFGLYQPVILSGSGENERELNTYTTLGSDQPVRTMIFENDNGITGGPLVFRTEGLYALNKDATELVVDTESRTVVKSPDEHLRFSDRTDTENRLALEMELASGSDPSISSVPRVGIYLDDRFTDGAGKEHFLQFTGGTSIEYRGSDTQATATYFFDIGPEQLPQPLTFRITGYPNLIEVQESVQIR